MSSPVRKGARWALIMKSLRRVHLYSGIALLPWVLIYGISAYLFNHGTAAPTEVLTVAAGTGEASPEPGRLAQRLLAALSTDESAPVEANHAAATLRGSWTFELRRDEQPYRLTIPVGGDAAQLRKRMRRRNPSTQLPADLFADEREAADRIARKTLSAAGITPQALRLVSGPSLSVPAGDTTWSSNLARDRAQASNNKAPSVERILKRLHVTHGYSRPQWQRTAWAILVDIMAAAMVLWSISGALMWWQKRSLRRTGAAALASGGIVLFVLVLALWDSF